MKQLLGRVGRPSSLRLRLGRYQVMREYGPEKGTTAMPQGSKAGTKAVPGQKAVKQGGRADTAVKQGGDLEKVLALIRKRPGIRPSEINRLLNREESDGLRSTLIKRGLVRKEKDGSASRYYPV